MSEAEHEPADSARPELDRRDAPDALRPEDDEDEDRADRKLLPDDDCIPREFRTEEERGSEEGPPEAQT